MVADKANSSCKRTTQSIWATDTVHHFMAGKLHSGRMQTYSEAVAAAKAFMVNPTTKRVDVIHAGQDGMAPRHYGQIWGPFNYPLDAIAHLYNDALPGKDVLAKARKATDEILDKGVDWSKYNDCP